MNLTGRQSDILKAIIEEYITTAQPIASIELVKKRALPLSGATVRNIMAHLVRGGYLVMPHVSSGRRPTDRAYRYYISELMDEIEISVLDEVTLKQTVWDDRYEIERLLCKAAEALSNATNSLGFALTEDEYITYSGTSKLLEVPEFQDIDSARAVFRLVDDYQLLRSVLERAGHPKQIAILIGREIGLANVDQVAMITTHSNISGKDCYLGVIGPARIKYEKVIPIVRHMANLLEEVVEST